MIGWRSAGIRSWTSWMWFPTSLQPSKPKAGHPFHAAEISARIPATVEAKRKKWENNIELLFFRIFQLRLLSLAKIIGNAVILIFQIKFRKFCKGKHRRAGKEVKARRLVNFNEDIRMTLVIIHGSRESEDVDKLAAYEVELHSLSPESLFQAPDVAHNVLTRGRNFLFVLSLPSYWLLLEPSWNRSRRRKSGTWDHSPKGFDVKGEIKKRRRRCK